MTAQCKLAESRRQRHHIVKVFDAPRQLVWDAWTQPEQFAQWFGEHGSSIPLESASMDVRPGGEWSVLMLHGPGQDGDPVRRRVRRAGRTERLVMTLKDPADPSSPTARLGRWCSTNLDDGRTEMDFRHTGGNLPEDEYARAMAGTLIFFERLAALVEPGALITTDQRGARGQAR